MKNIFSSILLAIILLSACNQKNDAIPKDLAGKKAYLKEKKAEVKDLQAKIDKVSSEVESLEPKRVKKKVLVTLDTIQVQQFDQFVEVQAIIAAEDFVSASSETGGRLHSLRVKEGDYVSKGSLIGTVDLVSLEKQLEELHSALFSCFYGIRKTEEVVGSKYWF